MNSVFINNVKKIELEITSACNASCPGCARTRNLSNLLVQHITLSDIKRIFPDKSFIKDKHFKLCGVLGDPIANPECKEIVEYILANEGDCQMSTNGGMQSEQWWKELGKLSASTRRLNVTFAVDGHKETNHIYRVNTKFSTIERNMKAYSDGGNGEAIGVWMYIVFDHNEHELPIAINHAKDLNFMFAKRTSMRNSMNGWLAKIKKRDSDTNKLVDDEKIITTTGIKEHARKAEALKVQEIVNEYITNKSKLSSDEIKSLTESIKCKLIHEGEMFISSSQELWPCCFLWDSKFNQSKELINALRQYDENWNSLKTNSIDDILNHDWFKNHLPSSWNPNSNQHLTRCINTCASNKAYQNQITFI